MTEDVRRSSIAGTWYPGTEGGLTSTVAGYLALVDQPIVSGKLLALISPHAGYAYSGQTAAYAYRQLDAMEVNTVVILGPSHRAWVGDYAVSSQDAYETPLGQVPLDRAFISDLGQEVSLQTVRHDSEHSLEIQLPFLQHQLGSFRLVPIMMSADHPAAARDLASGLVKVIGARTATGLRILIVASSDLHHIDNYDQVVQRDGPVIEAIAAYDLEALTPLLMTRDCSVCGRLPILTALYAAKELGGDKVKVLYRTNSGDITGQRHPGQYTVGYMAAAVYDSKSSENQG
jgi:AmmeMemoRadiSam system protein B